MEQELTELLEANREKYYRVAYTYAKNREDALDILHNAVVKAIQKVDSVRHRQFLETWFYRILINESITCVRQRQRTIYLEDLADFEPAQDAQHDPDQKVSVYVAIDRLPLKLKTVIILRFYEDLKFEEIAEITSTNLSTVKARLYRALKLLKNDMGGADL